MKRSIKHLPKHTQEELNHLLELIPQCIGGCEMIILYGSYARGGYVLWDEQVEFGVHTSYQSDLDILVVTSKSQTRSIESRLEEKVSKKYHDAFAHRRHPSPQIIVEHITTLNKALEKKQYFFTDIVTEGIRIYDSGKCQLAKPCALSFKEIKEFAQEEYNNCFPNGNELLFFAEMTLARQTYRNGSFLLHQASERFYYSILLVFTNYRPKNHRLKALEGMCKHLAMDVVTAFPRQTEFEEHCFDLLCRAYIEARYNKDFTVTREEYEYMLQRVKVFKELTERVCQERFAYYDDMIAQEEKTPQTGETNHG